MKNRIVALHALAACLASHVALAGEAWPSLSGEVSRQECSDARLVAVKSFNSTSSRLYAPPVLPEDLDSELILGPSDLDLSGGDSLIANSGQFEKVHLPNNDSIRNLYWQTGAVTDFRIVVAEEPLGWRGDMYSLLAIGADVERGVLLNKIEERKGSLEPYLVLPSTWRPPLVFQVKPTGQTWFIAVGEPHQILGNWNVYLNTPNGFRLGCTIRFRPETAKAENLLPPSVARLARLLDQTIGPGNNEGTLQSTARLRLDAQHVWANAALRPWALTEADTYNSRDEVDAALKAWSRIGASHKRIHSEIFRTYPIAQQSLCNYYRKNFLLSENKACRLAGYVLDVALRSNYTFPNGSDYFRYDDINTNPWTAH